MDANLFANRLQGWKHEADATRQLADEVSREPCLRTELDSFLEKLEVFGKGWHALPDGKRPWFNEALRRELGHPGSTTHYEAHITSSSTIAQGTGAVAADARGIALGVDAHDCINPGRSKQKGGAHARR